MSEMIATIIAGLPQMLLVVAIVGCALIYAFILDKALDGDHSILTGFVLAFSVFMCCMIVAYGFGRVV